MITLDASVVIAHLRPSDAHHRWATAYLHDSVDETVVIHSLNLAEVLVGGVRVGRGQEMADDLVAIGVVVAQRSEGEALRLATLRATTGLKLPDCCALDTALSTGSVLATLDHALARAGRGHRLTVVPEVVPEP